jgi:hypothetical protein
MLLLKPEWWYNPVSFTNNSKCQIKFKFSINNMNFLAKYRQQRHQHRDHQRRIVRKSLRENFKLNGRFKRNMPSLNYTVVLLKMSTWLSAYLEQMDVHK